MTCLEIVSGKGVECYQLPFKHLPGGGDIQEPFCFIFSNVFNIFILSLFMGVSVCDVC